MGRGFGQYEQGYRVVTTGVPLPGSAALANGWIMPTLTGPKLDLFGANSGAPTEVGDGLHRAALTSGPRSGPGATATTASRAETP